MYKFFLQFKKSITYLSILFLSNLLIINFSKAQTPNNKNTLENSINIEIPYENIKKVPIIGYKLVYQVYNASLVDFLNDKITQLKTYLSNAGIKEKNIVIIYTNYFGKTLNTSSLYDYKNPEIDSDINFAKYTTDEKICLNLEKLIKKYPLPFLTAKRSILIGTIVDNNTLFRGNDNLKVANFNFPDAKAISLFKADKENKVIKPEDKSTLSNNEYTKNNPIINYLYEELVQYRANMISYMNLTTFKNTEFIGMMEYQDTINKRYTYFALPGNLNDFLYPKKN